MESSNRATPIPIQQRQQDLTIEQKCIQTEDCNLQVLTCNCFALLCQLTQVKLLRQCLMFKLDPSSAGLDPRSDHARQIRETRLHQTSLKMLVNLGSTIQTPGQKQHMVMWWRTARGNSSYHMYLELLERHVHVLAFTHKSHPHAAICHYIISAQAMSRSDWQIGRLWTLLAVLFSLRFSEFHHWFKSAPFGRYTCQWRHCHAFQDSFFLFALAFQCQNCLCTAQ